jgi:hypothetical protein
LRQNEICGKQVSNRNTDYGPGPTRKVFHFNCVIRFTLPAM